MRSLVLLLAAVGVSLPAQPLKLDLTRLEAKASDKVNISLNRGTLQLASAFLDGKDAEEAQAKKLIEGIDTLDVRNFEFKTPGVWTQADLDGVRNQLRPPEWSRLVGYSSTEDGETAEVYVRQVKHKTLGIAVLTAEAKELTVVSIAGQIDLDSLTELSGHFGVPKLERKRK